MHRIARATFLLIIALIDFGPMILNRACAGPFSNLVVFGDSLSDVGNVEHNFLVDIPGPYYWNGRFSNGPIYAETLATGLGLPALNRSTASGGNDFAYGGAKTTGTGFPDNLVVKDIDDQVAQYVSSRTANATTLYIVFAGANDLNGGQTNMSIPVGSLQTSMERLFAAGARQFLIINLPPLGYTPRYNGSPSTITTYNTRSQQFNTTLATMAAGLKSNHPAIKLSQLDVYSLVNDARANPQLYGLTNISASAAPGLEPGDSSYDTTRLAPNPNQYLFWDDLHPTTAVHLILGHRALDLFFPPGDYNRNVASDAGDYVAFRKGLGATYVPIDFNIWRAHFGQTTPGASALGATSFASAIPEPQSAVLALGGILLAICRYSRPQKSLNPSANCTSGLS
jgi:thermolabile hemolysin